MASLTNIINEYAHWAPAVVCPPMPALAHYDIALIFCHQTGRPASPRLHAVPGTEVNTHFVNEQTVGTWIAHGTPDA